MTLAAVWCSYENAAAPVLWMASDSRISAEKDRLIDEGVKVFEIPVVCRGAGPDGSLIKSILRAPSALPAPEGRWSFRTFTERSFRCSGI